MKLIHIGDLNRGALLESHVVGFYRDKPRGQNILWAFPMDDGASWIDRAKSDDWLLHYWQAYQRGEYWTLKLDPNAKLAIIDSEADLKDLMNCFPVRNPTGAWGPERNGAIDWTRLSKRFDAFFLTRKGEKETRSPGGFPVSHMVDGKEVRIVTDEEIEAHFEEIGKHSYLTDWDFESVVVFNSTVVQVVSPPETRDP